MSNEKNRTNQVPNLDNLVEGWQFRLTEISPNYYQMEGNDRSGHIVSRSCSEIKINETSKKCADDARDIQKQIQEK